MGNDNKVSRGLTRKTEVFFRENAVETMDRPVLYSLEDEFAKTKKRKHLFVYAGAVLFAGALVVVTLVITGEVRRQSDAIKVDVSDFRDLNLTDLLQNTKKDETRLRSLMQEIADFRGNWQMEAQKVRDRYITERDIAAIRYADEADRQRALAVVQANERAELGTLDARYQKAIAERQKEIDEITKRLAGRDKKMVQGAQAMEMVLGSQLKLIEIERKKIEDQWRQRLDEAQNRFRLEAAEQRRLQKKLTDSLVLRYNPVFGDALMQGLIAGNSRLSGPGTQHAWQAILAREGVLDQAGFASLRKNIRDERTILERIIANRYTNSITPALNALGNRQAAVVAGYEALWSGLAARIEQKNSRLDSYNRAFAALMQQTREHGYILDTLRPDAYPVIVNPAYQVKSGDMAFVIRGENTRIGMVRLERSRDGLIAIPEGAFSDKPAALDKLLLQLR